MKKVGRQLSQSTKRAMGIGEDEEEFEDLRDHWLQKQLTVYSRYKSFLFGEMKPEGEREREGDQVQYGFEFEFLATASMGSDNVFSPDGSIRRMSSVGRSPSAAANNYVRTTAAAATTPAGIDPNASLNTTIGGGGTLSGRGRLASNASNLSSSVRIQRLPSVSEIGWDLMDRLILNRSNSRSATNNNNNNNHAFTQSGSSGVAAGIVEKYALSEDTLDWNCRENNLVIAGTTAAHTQGGAALLNSSAAGRFTTRQSSFSPSSSINRSGGGISHVTGSAAGTMLNDSQNFGRSRPLFLPTLNSEKEALKEDSSSSSASSSDEQEIDQKQEQLIAEMEEIDDAIDQSYEANDEDCATPQNDQTNSLHVEKSVQSRFRPHSLNVIGALVNNCEQRRERNKFTFGNVDSSHKVVKKGEEEGKEEVREKLSAAGSNIPTSRVHFLKRHLPAAGPRFHRRNKGCKQASDHKSPSRKASKAQSGGVRSSSSRMGAGAGGGGRNGLWTGLDSSGGLGASSGVVGGGGGGNQPPIVIMNPKMRRLDSHVRDQITGIHHHRPYFTLWICTVHVILLVTSLIQHGVGPFGLGMSSSSALVARRTVDAQQVALLEPHNVWIGPRPMELIKLGAKYTPCMTELAEVRLSLELDREKEKRTGCCVFMTATASTRQHSSSSSASTFCFQSSEEECVNRIATLDFFKYSNQSTAQGGGDGGEFRGPVCGLDPRYCELPSPVSHPWPPNITDWPICRRSSGGSSDYHMTCHITARPCCFGPLGQCIMASRDYCGFVRGIFHPEAFLCSQVSCLSEVCGLFPFEGGTSSPSPSPSPNQIYRLFTSLLVHAGVAHLLISLPLHWTFVRFMEILAGPFRTAAIYFLSGITGNLVSSILLPYQAQVGPYPCLFGILGSYCVEVYQMHPYLLRPLRAWMTLLFICLFLFLLGLLPWLDNFMNFSALTAGIALSLVLLPYIHVKRRDRRVKLCVSSIALTLYTALNALLLLLLLNGQLDEWAGQWVPHWIHTLTCVPFTADFCSHLNTHLKTG
ncbi:uncharacterized protein LOC134856176 isoform X2 [Symsagittifera roscoffensis]|uniref:uncharacterized protein LOC134856176 isoform X2 n=1 Tax=Symsagittifera roscoffensis TaxID=84072 RepID=UPI00307C9F8E